MATNPIGRDSKNISVNLPAPMRAELERLASESGLTLSAYVRKLLESGVRKRVRFVVMEEIDSQKQIANQ